MIVKRYVTLIEMMIVISIIVVIIGALGYNFQGSLERGKRFKTETGIEKIQTILSLVVAENPEAINNISTHWKEYIKKSPLVQNPETLYVDGWGKPYQVSVEDVDGVQMIKVTASK